MTGKVTRATSGPNTVSPTRTIGPSQQVDKIDKVERVEGAHALNQESSMGGLVGEETPRRDFDPEEAGLIIDKVV